MFYVYIRGAITVEQNDKDEMLEATKELLQEIMERNQMVTDDICAIIFTATKDLTKVYPAVAARELGITKGALMCVQEMDVEGSLPKCIRVMMTAGLQSEKKPDELQHVYLKGAAVLRPDLKRCAVAVDGPVGSGKSTAARLAAAELGFIYIDTGAMYRAVALYCISNKIDLQDEKAIENCLPLIDISIEHGERGQEIYVNGEDVTESIRTQQIADGSSKVAAIQRVREKLVAIQQKLAGRNSVVMDGRDIGTKVLPKAQVKIYMDANAQVRTARRVSELEKRGLPADFERIKREIEERDFRDMNRSHSPLQKAEDAVYLDTSQMNQEEAKDAIVAIVKERGLV